MRLISSSKLATLCLVLGAAAVWACSSQSQEERDKDVQSMASAMVTIDAGPAISVNISDCSAFVGGQTANYFANPGYYVFRYKLVRPDGTTDGWYNGSVANARTADEIASELLWPTGTPSKFAPVLGDAPGAITVPNGTYLTTFGMGRNSDRGSIVIKEPGRDVRCVELRPDLLATGGFWYTNPYATTVRLTLVNGGTYSYTQTDCVTALPAP